MASSTVYIGSTSDPLFSFDDNSLTSISLENSLSIIGDELKIDTFEFDVRYTGEGSIEAVDYGTPVYFYRDGAMMGKFYFIRATRLSQYNHKVYCESIIGLLDRDTFYGGIYSNTSFRNVVESIISSNGLQRYYLYKKIAVPNTLNSLLLSGDGYGEATMNCRMMVGVSIVPRGSTYFTSHIAGELAPGGSTTDYDWNQSYRIALRVNNSSNVYSFVVTLSFGRYSETRITVPIDSADINSNQFLEISVDPVSAVFSVDYKGTTYSAAFNTSEANLSHIAPLYVFGGKFTFSSKDNSTGKFTQTSSNTAQGSTNFHYYRVYSPDDILLIDAEVVKDIESGLLYVRNKATGFRTLLEGCTPEESDVNYSSEDLDVVRSSYDLATVIEGTQFINGAGELVLNGWIPILSKRQALQQVLFATGASLLKGGNGEMVFTIVTDQTAEAIPDSAVYIDGDVEYPSMTNTIDVTEFSYETIEADAVEIFNNQDASAVPDIYIAVFNSQPVFSNISAEGLTILAANANAAVVTGRGRILGHPYVRNETVISAVLGDRPDGKTVAIPDVGLVNFGNSAAIVDRLKRYYRDAHTARPHIALTSQKCGTKYSFTNAFRETDSGFLTKISCIMSAKIKAACELICGFSPSGSGSEYSNFVLLTGSGTWTVPAEVFEQDTPKIKAVLIGGGKGGYSGKAGADGAHIRTSDANWKTMVKAEGGDPGEPGTGGRVYVVTITNPAASYTYACGAGGAGGQPSGQSTIEGSAGGATTLSDGSTTRSSASGTVRAQGIANEITGRVYAKPGTSWTGRSGGKGGAGGYYTIEDGVVTQIAAEAVHNELTGYTSAAGSKGTDVISGGSIVSLGGCGGGAAGGYQSARPLYNNQFEGFDGYNAKAASGSELARGGEGGHGGNGLLYTPPTPEDYGSGGMGGVGGGGGGAAGGTNPDMASQFTLSVSGGTGGSGGPGGSGADGCIIIYY